MNLDKNVASHGLTNVSLDVAFVLDVVAKKFNLLTVVPDVDVALEPNVVLSSSVALFLKECEIFARYLNAEVDMGQPLSDNGDDVVKITRRPGRPRKCFKMYTNKK